MSEATIPFFHRDGDWLIPTDIAQSPWNAKSLHGRVIVGLLAAEIERHHSDPDFTPARLTVDMHRAPGMVPQQVETRLVRDGKRIRVIDAELISDGQSVGRATCQMLRRTQNPVVGQGWHGDSWDAPLPDTLPPMPAGLANMHGLWDMRIISGRIGQNCQRRLWMRETHPLIGGEALTPFLHVAAGADYASPLANSGDDDGYTFVNSDLTLYLHRLPVSDWIGYETIAHEATDGVGLAHCNLYDVEGRIGWGSACALAQMLKR